MRGPALHPARCRPAGPVARDAARAGAVAGCLLLGVVNVACRDAAEPFVPVDRQPVPDATLVRLTYSSGDDRTPVWSAAGDSLYYTASNYEGTPLAPGTVVAVAADGVGQAVPVLRNVQEGTQLGNWITAPALSANGRQVAYVRIPPLLPAMPCNGTRVCPIMQNLPMVRLTRIEVHARAIDASNGPADDLVLPLALEGYSQVASASAPGGVLTVTDYHPFQYEFETNGRAFFRPTWSPDGSELVVSDGLRLLRWRMGAATATPIPDTDDGLSPAWSPDGEWIAFARFTRYASQTFDCQYQNTYVDANGNPIVITDCVERRTMHWATLPRIDLARPDGSDQHVLALGSDPAWSPDGRHIYATAADGTPGIVRISVADGSASFVDRTEGGVEPAVSPDGRWLAFARAPLTAPFGNKDIWVVELP